MAIFDPGSWWKKAKTLMRGFRPAVPAALGAVALTFLFAAVMPMAWVRNLAWNLYLDRLSSYFVPPVGDAGRLALAIGMALIAGLLAVLVALAMASPDVRGNGAMNRRVAARARQQDDAEEELQRRRADRHPDDNPRPPIRAARDLPPEGLGPVLAKDLAVAEEGSSHGLVPNDGDSLSENADDGDDALLELTLGDVADDDDPAQETHDMASPDLTPAPVPAPAPYYRDASLGAMVARFETGMARRKQLRDADIVPKSLSTDAANEDEEPEIDFALEAALSTLQRMSRSAIG